MAGSVLLWQHHLSTMIRKQVTPDEALARLEQLCARSEQCSHEVMQKMLRWGIAADERGRILDRLVERRFVDDSRYASAYAREKFLFSRWGRRKIKLGLVAKRIARPLIDEAVAEATQSDAYIETLRRLMLTKMRGMEVPLGREDALKLCRFAMQRGFEWDYVSAVLGEVRNGVSDDEEDF